MSGVVSMAGIAKKSVGWAIAFSILLIVAGILAIVVPPVAGIAVAVLVAWMLLLAGISHLAFAFQVRTTKGVIWQVLTGLLDLAVAVFLLLRPVAGLASLTLLLAAYLFADAILEFVLAFRLRPLPGTGWLLFNGVVALVLAAMIGLTWPWSSEWAIGTLVGCSLLFAGISRLSLSLAAHKVVSALP